MPSIIYVKFSIGLCPRGGGGNSSKQSNGSSSRELEHTGQYTELQATKLTEDCNCYGCKTKYRIDSKGQFHKKFLKGMIQ
jgi:hypothetical protein